jgi:hypothetical protein
VDVDALEEFQLHLETGDKAHPAKGEIDQRGQVMVYFAGYQVKAVGSDKISEKDKGCAGV